MRVNIKIKEDVQEIKTEIGEDSYRLLIFKGEWNKTRVFKEITLAKSEDSYCLITYRKILNPIVKVKDIFYKNENARKVFERKIGAARIYLEGWIEEETTMELKNLKTGKVSKERRISLSQYDEMGSFKDYIEIYHWAVKREDLYIDISKSMEKNKEFMKFFNSLFKEGDYEKARLL